MKKGLGVLGLLFFFFSVWFYFWGSARAYDTLPLTDIQIYSEAKAPKDTFKLMTYNLGYLSGMTNNKAVDRNETLFSNNLERFITLTKQRSPDLIAFQEIDFQSERSFNQDQFEAICKQAGFAFGARVINWDKNYVPFPYFSFSQHFGKMLSGQAVASQYPILENSRQTLCKPVNAPFFYKKFYLDRLAQVTLIDFGSPVYVVNVHFEAFDKTTRETQAHELVNLCKPLMETYPLILMGDFNTVPLEAKNKNPYDDSQDRYENETTLKTIQEGLGVQEIYPKHFYKTDETDSFTFSSANPKGKIDHIFYDPKTIELIRYKTLHEFADISDHLPIEMVFRLKK